MLVDERAVAALREQFIAVLGHDLRNPLSGIMGGVQLLQRMQLNDRAQETRRYDGTRRRPNGGTDR